MSRALIPSRVLLIGLIGGMTLLGRPANADQPSIDGIGRTDAYGVDTHAFVRRATEYVDKFLKGTNRGNLPVEQATQYRLLVNLKMAKTLGLTIAQSLLLRADGVIR